MKKLLFLIGSLSALIVSCDIYEKDVEPKVNIIKATAGSFATIRANSYFGSASSYAISKQPQNGFTFFSPGSDSEYLQYGSLSDFSSSDSFTVSAKNSNGDVIETQNFLITRASSCGLGPVQDTVNVKVGELVVIDLLMNDYFCDVNFVDVAISEGLRGGNGGDLTYVINKVDKKVTLTFQAGSTPGSYLYSYYTLGLNPDFDLSTAPFDWKDHPERFERFHSVNINFNVIE